MDNKNDWEKTTYEQTQTKTATNKQSLNTLLQSVASPDRSA